DSEAFARGYRIKNLSNDTTISNAVIVDNAMIGGTVAGSGVVGTDTGTRPSGFGVFTINDNDSRVAEVTSYGVNAEWRLGSWTINADVSRSESDGNFQNAGTRAMLYNDNAV